MIADIPAFKLLVRNGCVKGRKINSMLVLIIMNF